MGLTRGDKPIEDVWVGRPPGADGAAVVIAIAPSMEAKVQIASLVAGHAPVLLVSSREEALAMLVAGGAPHDGPPGPGPVDESPVPSHAVEERGGLEIDSEWRVATWSGRSVSLSPLEHDVLGCLLARLGRICTFESLHREVWGNDHLGGLADVWSVVKRLRRKLDGLGCAFRIQAVRGVGLRLVDPGTVTLPGLQPSPVQTG